jgi:AraC family transcriptional regulator
MAPLHQGSRADVRYWPGLRSEYYWIAASDGATRTKSNQVGVSFSAHRDAVYQAAGRTTQGDIAPGAVFVTGPEPIAWLRIGETTEALEVYPDPELLRAAGDATSGTPQLEPAAGARDGTVLAICSVLKQAHTAGAALSDMAASTLAHRLAGHLLSHYGQSRCRPARPAGRLDRKTVDRVTEFVDAGLSGTLTLDQLGRVAALSPFHFAHAFKATTGVSPHQFVVARRMHRAVLLLAETNLPVSEVATAIGFSNVSHFRRLFRREVGVQPGELRENRKIGPCAARARAASIRRSVTPQVVNHGDVPPAGYSAATTGA